MCCRFSSDPQNSSCVRLIKMPTATIFLLCIITLASSVHLPPQIPSCKTTDEDCLKSSAHSAFSSLVNGNEELGIPPIDPIAMGTLSVKPKPGPISIFQKYENTTICGVSKVKVSKFTVDLKNCHIFMEVLIPDLEVYSKYEIRGQLLLLPVDAQGSFAAKFKNFTIKQTLFCEIFKDQGIEFLRVTKSETVFSAEQLEMNLGKLINGNDQLDQQVHKVIDEDPLGFFEIIRPATEEMWSSKIKDIVNNFFTKVSRNELFQD